MAQDVTVENGARLTRRQAAADIVAVLVLVPISAIGAGVTVGVFSSGQPSLAVIVLIQALLVLAGTYVILGSREQGFGHIGLTRLRAGDFGRALVVVLAGFAVNAALTLTVILFSPGTLEEHVAGLESFALGLAGGLPLASTLGLLLLVGFYEEVVARGMLLTRIRELTGGFWVPALISAVLFALGHFYQGLYGVVQTALLGLVLAIFTLRWGTLWPAIIAHSAINMLSVIQLGQLSE